MKIKIYNAKIETSYVFQPWEYAQNQFDLNDYDLVGEGDIKFDECLGRNVQLEALFATFNGRYMCTDTIDISNFKYSGHSLSVSDVIYFIDENEGEYYYVDVVGFVKVGSVRIQVKNTDEKDINDIIVYDMLKLAKDFEIRLRPRYYVDKEDVVNYLQFLGLESNILDEDHRLPYIGNSKKQK